MQEGPKIKMIKGKKETVKEFLREREPIRKPKQWIAYDLNGRELGTIKNFHEKQEMFKGKIVVFEPLF